MTLPVGMLLALYLLLPAHVVADEPPAVIHVVDHGWHTGIIVAAEPAERALPFLRERFHQPAWYEFGWGDAGFYQAQEITLSLALAALFDSDGSVVHVVAVSPDPGRYFSGGELARLEVTPDRLQQVLAFIAAAFARRDGDVVMLSAGIYGDSQFYHSELEYHLRNTCNRWTAQALRAAGVEIVPDEVLFAGQVMSALE